MTHRSRRPVSRGQRVAWMLSGLSGGRTCSGGVMNDSRRVPDSLSRDYLDNRAGLETMAAAVATADQEAVLRLNRQALASDYERQRQRLDQIAGTRTEAGSMAEDDTEFRVDSPQTTTINNSGVPAWVPVALAMAAGLGGAGLGVGMMAMRQPQPAAPAVRAPATDTDTDTQYRVVLE